MKKFHCKIQSCISFLVVTFLEISVCVFVCLHFETARDKILTCITFLIAFFSQVCVLKNEVFSIVYASKTELSCKVFGKEIWQFQWGDVYSISLFYSRFARSIRIEYNSLYPIRGIVEIETGGKALSILKEVCSRKDLRKYLYSIEGNLFAKINPENTEQFGNS